jgi:hypothetical protein
MRSRNIIRQTIRTLRWGAILIIPLLTSTAVAQQVKESEARVENARWSVQGNDIVIVFDLNAPADRTYKISIVLRREGDKSFAVVPKTVTGAVGEGKYAGQREVRWAFRKDIPAGLAGNDFWFEISADEIVDTGISKFWYYAGGAAAIIAGGVTYMAAKQAASPSGPPKLPTPPLNRPLE